jgi:K+ transporter
LVKKVSGESQKLRVVLLLIVLCGTSMVIGDGVLTLAILG